MGMLLRRHDSKGVEKSTPIIEPKKEVVKEDKQPRKKTEK